MPKVFVLNRGAHDYAKASRFGDIIYLSDGTLSKFSTGTMYRLLWDALKSSSPDDYILLSSLTTLCCIAASIMTHLHGKVNYLIFNNGDYIHRQVNLNKEFQNDN